MWRCKFRMRAVSLAYHSVGVEPEGAARELAGAGVGGEGRAVRKRGPHEVRVAEQRDVPILVVRGDRRGVADDEDVGAIAVGLLLLLLLHLLRDERQDLLPEVDQDDLLGSKRRTTASATGTTPDADGNSVRRCTYVHGGAERRFRRRCPPARPSTAGTSSCWRTGARRGAAAPAPSTRTAAAAPGARGPAASCSG
jgi:hypothetical protein